MDILTNSQLLLSIEVEQKSGQGEDSAACVVVPDRAAFIAALDGCGGAGSKKYSVAENWTGARIASFSCAQTMVDWFYDNKIDQFGFQSYPAKAVAQSLKQALVERITELQQLTSAEGSRLVLSNMVKPFPTTLSAALVCRDNNVIRCLMMWAGDSRGYVLSNRGLYQITKDDLKGEIDPFDNLEQDGVLSNVVSANDFYVNVKDININDKCILLVATDGCYGYLRSPMEYEFMLLSTLMSARSLKEWEDQLSNRIGLRAADDFTLLALGLGFESFDQIKNHYRDTFQRFQKDYGKCMNPETSQYELRQLWNNYQQQYMWGNNK
ncbi:MAG: protein phosphatase 2C domain-containing protein [Anaerolineaceae bacterium]|nr:protein phosphatase 2C domain-containing protein [Anaerolineaceae bacterium]